VCGCVSLWTFSAADNVPAVAAMRLINAGVEVVTVALWLGHQNVATTQIYVHADLALKERELARTAPEDLPPGRYRPSDKLLAFLEGL
jgi:integrase/recombinase XerD